MATPRSVAASPDARVTSPHQLHLLRLLDGRFVAICSCRWTGERYHPRRENAYTEAQNHALEHDVQLSLIDTRSLEDGPRLETTRDELDQALEQLERHRGELGEGPASAIALFLLALTLLLHLVDHTIGG